jgi:hypothetical protein
MILNIFFLAVVGCLVASPLAASGHLIEQPNDPTTPLPSNNNNNHIRGGSSNAAVFERRTQRVGDFCLSIRDCFDGLRCRDNACIVDGNDANGNSFGNGNLGARCTYSSDCVRGLDCKDRTCVAIVIAGNGNVVVAGGNHGNGVVIAGNVGGNTGIGRIGDRCYASSDCARGLGCSRRTYTCVAVAASNNGNVVIVGGSGGGAGIGDFCYSSSDCALGLGCQFSACYIIAGTTVNGNGVIIASGGADASCFDSLDCANGLYCDSFYGVCRIDNGVIGSSVECFDSFDCANGFYCDGVYGVCRIDNVGGSSAAANDNFGALGADCLSIRDCRTGLRCRNNECILDDEDDIFAGTSEICNAYFDDPCLRTADCCDFLNCRSNRCR